ncbi:MAG: RDD family protein, partial [Mycobacterium sp.]
MTVVVEKTETTPAVDDAASNELACWHIRAAAFFVDVLPGLAVLTTMVLVWLAVPLRSVWWWLSVSVLAAAALLTMANRVILPTLTGWSLGRAL